MNEASRPAKTVAESKTEQCHLLMPRDANSYNRLFGGQLMEWIDLVAGSVARRHCECNITTASIDNLQFKAPAHVGDLVVLMGQVTYTGNTSMEVRVQTFVEDLHGMRKLINRVHLVMVALDAEEKPIQVPRISSETMEEQYEYECAVKRNAFRKQRRKESF